MLYTVVTCRVIFVYLFFQPPYTYILLYNYVVHTVVLCRIRVVYSFLQPPHTYLLLYNIQLYVLYSRAMLYHSRVFMPPAAAYISSAV